jgi:hypothetical protein
MNKHVMLDLETLGTGPNATIIGIGAVAFTLDGEIHEQFSDYVGRNDDGATTDVDTVLWWFGQSDAREVQTHVEYRFNLIDALYRFGAFMSRTGMDVPIAGMWGNGVAFDNVILRSAFERNGMTAPWDYRTDRCYRTMKAMRPDVKAGEFVGVKHDALDDAIHQAKHLCKILAS